MKPKLKVGMLERATAESVYLLVLVTLKCFVNGITAKIKNLTPCTFHCGVNRKYGGSVTKVMRGEAHQTQGTNQPG